MDIKDKRFSILGIAKSGLAAAEKVSSLGGKVFLSDFKSIDKVPEYSNIVDVFDCEFGGHTSRVLDADYIVVSPGVPLNIPILIEAKKRGIEVISEIELGFRIKSPDSKLICCTGSNGKSTTVSLIHHILVNCGYNSILAGNIGTPFTSYPIEDRGIDFIVLELSSFQLELIDQFKADVSLLLNLTPDHLDRYDSFEHYALTKLNIFNNQTTQNTAVLNFDDPLIQKLSSKIKASMKWFSIKEPADAFINNNILNIGKSSYPIDNISLKGPHNQLNIMAALLAVEKFTSNCENLIAKSLQTFSPLPHRLETVETINGVLYVNDSKATNTDSVKFALQSFSNRIHIILGGSDKGEDFGVLIPYLTEPKVSVYLIGATKERMQSSFSGRINYLICKDLEDAVKEAYKAAKPGEVVILSPACASYDAFANFIQRGNRFKAIVRDLKNANNTGKTQAD